MASTVDIVFAQSPLDRVSERRRDRAWLDQQLGDPDSRYLVFWKLQALVRGEGEPAIAWANGDVRDVASETGAVLLGLDGDVAHFAVDVSGLEKPVEELGLAGVARFSEVRAIAGQVATGQAAMLAQGRAMLGWHERHRFCSACGEPTRAADAGYLRMCADCGAEHFPRTDPVVIMLVERAGRCLLGRQRGWPPGMFSALAGFVEPGETIEEAVRREVREEASIDVGAVRYVASQPWPFPSSLMIGCIGEGLSDDVQPGDHELEDARWFELAHVRKALASGGSADGLFVPPPMAIAHQLLRAWSGEG